MPNVVLAPKTRKKLLKRAPPDHSPAPAARSPTRLPGAQCLDRHRVLPVRPLLRNRRPFPLRRPPRRRRRVAAYRLPDEPQGPTADRQRARAPPCRHVPAHCFSRAFVDFPQEFLRVVLPRGNGVRILVAPRPPILPPQFPVAARPADIALRSLKYILLGLFLYAVGSMSVPAIRAFPARPLWGGRRCEDAQLLPLPGPGRRHHHCHPGCSLSLRSELLVPLSLPIRRADGPRRAGQSLAHPPRSQPLHRLREVRQSLPGGIAGRSSDDAIRSAECTGCLECVAACPASGALYLGADVGQTTVLRRLPTTSPKHVPIPALAIAAGIALIFLSVCSYARWTGHWNTDLPARVYSDLIPHANEFQHP